MEYVTIGGQDVPALGLGTWQLTGSDCSRAVEQALGLGYRHLDTAQMYGNEDRVGAALQAADVEREALFITTKIDNANHAPADVVTSTEDSLRRLGTDYVDLLLIHWPVAFGLLPATLEAMRELRDEGKVRHLGVSNFTAEQVQEAREHATIFCNQVEYHPYLSQQDLLELARRHDFLLTAYSPLARGKVLDDDVLVGIGQHHGKSPAQVVLRWLLDQDHVAAIPKATSRKHLEANLDVFDFTLTPEERARIDDLERGDRIIDPGWAPDW